MCPCTHEKCKPQVMCMQGRMWRHRADPHVADPLRSMAPSICRPALLVTTRDVSARAHVEGLLVELTEQQLNMVAQMFPQHIIGEGSEGLNKGVDRVDHGVGWLDQGAPGCPGWGGRVRRPSQPLDPMRPCRASGHHPEGRPWPRHAGHFRSRAPP